MTLRLPAPVISWQPRSRLHYAPYQRSRDPLWLLTVEELSALPSGTCVVGVDDRVYVVGFDQIPTERSFEFLRVGLLGSQLSQLPLPGLER